MNETQVLGMITAIAQSIADELQGIDQRVQDLQGSEQALRMAMQGSDGCHLPLPLQSLARLQQTLAHLNGLGLLDRFVDGKDQAAIG